MVLANLMGIELVSDVRSSGWEVRSSELGGRHRPQRCRQTDLTAGEAVAMSKLSLRGWLKAIAVVLVRLF